MIGAIDPSFTQDISIGTCMGVPVLFDSTNTSMLGFLDAIRGHQATDPRDKVYGLLGILQQKLGSGVLTLKVDNKKSVAEVYTDIALKVLRVSKTLQLLDYVTQPQSFEGNCSNPS